MNDVQLKRAADLYVSGKYTLEELAKRYGMSTAWLYQRLRGKDGGEALIDDSTIREVHLRRFYSFHDSKMFKKCVKCKVEKEISKANFYFNKQGMIKYSTCKPCFITSVSKRKKGRRGDRRGSA